MYKYELAAHLGFSKKKLQKLMNVTYLEDLKPLGYEKNVQLLSPNVVRKVLELYGKPLSKTEIYE